jgi:hypothetical protein
MRRERQRAAALIEAPIVMIVVILLILCSIDMGRVALIRYLIRWRTTEVLKAAQGDLRLQFNVWNESGGPGYGDFVTAREDAMRQFMSRLLLLTGVRIPSITHFDLFSDMSERPVNLPLAYLPPGFSATVDGWGITVHNSAICSPLRATASSPISVQGVTTVCGQVLRPKSASLQALSRIYPTEVITFFEVKTLFFGDKKFAAVVPGYPVSDVPWTAPVPPTATPTPAPSFISPGMLTALVLY